MLCRWRDFYKNLSAGKDTSYFNLLRRPKNTFNTTVGFQASKKLFASIGLRWVDKRDDQFYNSATFKTEKRAELLL
jgi:vitamin B12 transporter